VLSVVGGDISTGVLPLEYRGDGDLHVPPHRSAFRRATARVGYALRFPRLASFRSADKRPENATTAREILELYAQQGRHTTKAA
jgi:ATP-dependent DNA ligase